MLGTAQTAIHHKPHRHAQAQTVGFHGMEFALIPLDKVTILISAV
jgi:hypothetical protein